MVAVRGAARHPELGFGLQVRIGGLVVGQVHDVAPHPVLPPVEHPVLFQAAVEVGEVRLVPLHRVVAPGRRHRAHQARRIGRGQAVLGQHELADVHAALVQEDAAVGAARQQPQLGAQGQGVVAHVAGHHLALVQGDAQRVPGALLLVGAAVRLAVVQGDGHVHQLADQVAGLQVGAAGADDGGEGEQLADLLHAVERFQQQRVLAQGRVDPQQAAGLRVGGGVGHGGEPGWRRGGAYRGAGGGTITRPARHRPNRSGSSTSASLWSRGGRLAAQLVQPRRGGVSGASWSTGMSCRARTTWRSKARAGPA